MIGRHQRSRYSEAARKTGGALCCPTSYDPGLLAAIPDEVIDREGIEFRSTTVAAYKGKDGPCMDHRQAVVYRGPFREVVDDDGHVLRRGVRTAVCAKTFGIYSREPYRGHLDLVEPHVAMPADEARPFPCAKGTLVRSPRETKGRDFALTTEAPGTMCATDSGCC